MRNAPHAPCRREAAAKLAAKLKSKKGFDLGDFREQMLQMQNMGGFDSLLEKLPGGANLQAQLKNVNPEKQVKAFNPHPLVRT